MSMFRRDIANIRCFNHAQREAAARCPECGRHFCRECVSEHSGRFLCATCIASQSSGKEDSLPSRARLRSLMQFVAGILLLWTLLYGMGAGLLQIPSVFHEDMDNSARYWDEP